MPSISYGYVRPVALSFEEAIPQLEAALKSQGFGVLFTIDMQAKLREKLGVEFTKYVILGACNPPIAYQALSQEIGLGLLLPCNAVVFEHEGKVHVGTIDAARMLSIVGNEGMAPMGEQVNAALRRAVDTVAGA
jgi:uncharacterized protein (DUF302 family)